MEAQQVAEVIAWAVNAGRPASQNDAMVSEWDGRKVVSTFPYTVTDKREDGFTFTVYEGVDADGNPMNGIAYDVSVTKAKG